MDVVNAFILLCDTIGSVHDCFGVVHTYISCFLEAIQFQQFSLIQ